MILHTVAFYYIFLVEDVSDRWCTVLLDSLEDSVLAEDFLVQSHPV